MASTQSLLKTVLSFFWEYLPTILTFGGALVAAMGVLLQNLRQQEITKRNLGGKSFCYVRPESIYNAPGQKVSLMAFQAGDKYPVYDVDVMLTNLSNPMPGFARRIRVGTIGAGQWERITDLDLPQSGSIRFLIMAVSARNGQISEILRFEHLAKPPPGISFIQLDPSKPLFEQLTKPVTIDPAKGAWVSAWKVVRGTDNEKVEEIVPPGFPKNDKGDVEWGIGGF